MASSGTVNSSKYGQWYLQLNWTQKAKNSLTNQSTVDWNVKTIRASGSGSYYVGNISTVINGVTVYSCDNSNRWLMTNGETVASGTIYITHNNDGTKSFSASIKGAIYSYADNVSGSGSFTLDTIPRYASISQSLSSRTETSLTISWASDSTCDYLWYSKDNGATWAGVTIGSATKGTYTITGLTAGTSYNVKTRVRRKDSQLTSDSSALSVSTYAKPYANSTPDFVLGNPLTLGIFNPLRKEIEVELLDKNGAVITSAHGGFSTITFFRDYDPTSEINALYASIPDSKTGVYSVRVISVDDSTSTLTTGGTYSVDASVASPVIGSVSYADINPNTLPVIQDATKIVQNLGIVRYSAIDVVAKKSASIVSVEVAVNGAEYDLTQSGTTWTGGDGTINSSSDVVAVFTVTDSRGLQNTKNITVTMLAWTLPTALVTVGRVSNFYSTTDMKVDADYPSLDGKNTITITYVGQAVPQTGQTTPTDVSGSLQDNVTSQDNFDNNFAWNIIITLKDAFNATATYRAYISRGIPLTYFDRHRNSVGINQFPQYDGAFEVTGKIYLNGQEIGSGDVTAEYVDEVTGEIPNIFDKIYPIGSIYLSVNSANPSTLFGGTWEQIKDRFLLSAGDTYQGGETGGESSHTLTVNEIPNHTHAYGQYAGEAGWSGTSPQRNFLKTTNTDGYTNTNNNGYMTTLGRGGGQAHNNMPPYMAVFAWKRTA